MTATYKTHWCLCVFSALILVVGVQEKHLGCKNLLELSQRFHCGENADLK